MLKAHDSKIRKRLNKYCLFGSFARRKAILSKENMAAELVKFVSFNLNKTQDFWKFEQMRSGWRCLTVMHSAIFGENQTQDTSY